MKKLYSKNKYNNKGITLVALIITIILLLILAGVAVAQLSESELFLSAQRAQKEQKKAQYFEEINLEIYTEQIEMLSGKKQGLLIDNLGERMQEKEWAQVVMINQNMLVIETIDGYEILIDVNNEENNATIRDSFEKTEEKIMYTVKYNKNEGEGTELKDQKIREGFSIKLLENTYTRTNYEFAGWCENADGSTEIYLPNSNYTPVKDTTLYAIWIKNTVTISFNSNIENATGSTESITVAKRQEVTLNTNGFSKTGYSFVKWNTKADGTGTDYENVAKLTVGDDDIILYAIWVIQQDKYAVLTKYGVISSSTLASNALGYNAYDDDLTSAVNLPRDSDRFIYVDKSAYNKNMKLDILVGGSGDAVVYFYNNNDSVLKKHIFYTSGKGLGSFSETERTLIGTNVITTCSIQIPDNTYKISFYKWNTSATSKIYNIDIEK